MTLSQEHVRVQELCTFENTLIHTCACAHRHGRKYTGAVWHRAQFQFGMLMAIITS